LHTATKSICLFEQLIDVIQSPAYEPMQRIIMDLYKNATTAISKAQLDQSDQLNEANVFNPTSYTNEVNVDTIAEGTVFPEFEWDTSELADLEFDNLFNPFLND
jgi:hypothetical protein